MRVGRFFSHSPHKGAAMQASDEVRRMERLDRLARSAKALVEEMQEIQNA